MFRPNKIFLFVIFFVQLLFAQKIQTIEIKGNTVFDDDEYLEWAGISAGVEYYDGLLDSVKSNIASELALRGYFHASFEGSESILSPDSQSVNILLNINEDDPAYVNKFVISKEDSILLYEAAPSISFLLDDPFNKFELENYLNEGLTYLENNGYPFAKIVLKSVYFYYDSLEEEHYADIYLAIEEGEKRTIDKIEINGNTSTKDFVIIRELRLDKGEEYSQEKIEELPKRLNRLRFFEPVGTPGFYINSEGEGVLLINVKEKNTNNFDGIIGYIPGTDENEKGYLTGLVNVSLRNLFGTGRAAAIRWQQFDRFSQEMELRYLEPWLFGYPFNINVDFFQRKQDTTYVQRRFGGGLEFLATEDISASLTLSSQSIIPTERDSSIFTVYNSNSITTGLNLKIDTRDDPYAPTEGLFFITSYSFSRKKINGPKQFITPQTETNINLQRIELNLNGYYELFARQIIALGLNGRELRGSFFEVSDLYRLGGTNSLRGYREDQFLGSRIFWTNLEYRFLLTRRSFAFAFFDTGYYLRPADEERSILKQEDFTYGYGVGLNIETGLGVLGVSFAIAEGQSFGDGLIHFGIVNEF